MRLIGLLLLLAVLVVGFLQVMRSATAPAPVVVAAPARSAASNSNRELEAAIAELEGEIARLENKSAPQRRIESAQTDEPAASTTSSDDGTSWTVNGQVRRDERDCGNPCSFNAGEAVFAAAIDIGADGTYDCDHGNCYLANAPRGGLAWGAAINPWRSEIEGRNLKRI